MTLPGGSRWSVSMKYQSRDERSSASKKAHAYEAEAV